MRLSTVSITGPDDAVSVADLNALAAEFQFLEIAVLHDPEKAGARRFPQRAWIEAFCAAYTGPSKAMHLCNQALILFANGDAATCALVDQFHRIQLNFKFGGAGEKVDMDSLVAQVAARPAIQFILQYGEDGASLLDAFDGVGNVALLFDKSAGEGVLPATWPKPVPGFPCGYAGGLGPENVAAQLPLIAAAAGDKPFWIDMETRVRSNDVFDFAKVRSVLEQAAPHIT